MGDIIYICVQNGNLMDALASAGACIENLCNGNGTCGKCKVKILLGKVSPMSEPEEQLLNEEEKKANIRLACKTFVYGDAFVQLIHKEQDCQILTSGYLPHFDKDRNGNGYGIALDIGTTTVAGALIDLKTGKEIATVSRLNDQRRFGMDVMTRITYESSYPERGKRELQDAIVYGINEMIGELCRGAKITGKDLLEIDVAANCTMMHMLLGEDARTIGIFPYRPVFTKARSLLAGDIGIDAGRDTILYCLPQVSAYIGADIVAGAYVCGLGKDRGTSLFIDIGTNCEIVLSFSGKLFSCSCAAGPALEGMNISCGMRAERGAIEAVKISESGIQLSTIGGGSPTGICGSGILSAVKELLDTGMIKKTGVFIKTEDLEPLDYRRRFLRMNGTKRELLLHREPELLVTQKDIRQVQLAKGAILSGITVLLEYAGIQVKDLDKVIIAGQFGSCISPGLLEATGILPDGISGKVSYVGNSSKSGAYMALMSQTIKQEMEHLAGQVTYIELENTKGYERLFAESTVFH